MFRTMNISVEHGSAPIMLKVRPNDTVEVMYQKLEEKGVTTGKDFVLLWHTHSNTYKWFCPLDYERTLDQYGVENGCKLISARTIANKGVKFGENALCSQEAGCIPKKKKKKKKKKTRQKQNTEKRKKKNVSKANKENEHNIHEDQANISLGRNGGAGLGELAVETGNTCKSECTGIVGSLTPELRKMYEEEFIESAGQGWSKRLGELLDDQKVASVDVMVRGCTALVWACVEGETSTVQWLLKRGADKELPARFYFSRYGSSLDLEDNPIITPLQAAIRVGHVAVVQLLLCVHGAAPASPEYCLSSGAVPAVRFLQLLWVVPPGVFKARAEASVAASLAASAVSYLLDFTELHDWDKPFKTLHKLENNEIIRACGDGDIDRVRALVASSPFDRLDDLEGFWSACGAFGRPSWSGGDVVTSMGAACSAGQLEVMQFLVQDGWHVDQSFWNIDSTMRFDHREGKECPRLQSTFSLAIRSGSLAAVQ
jgi:hypothetical protein